MTLRFPQHPCVSLFRLPAAGLLFLFLVALAAPQWAYAADKEAAVTTHNLLPGIKAEIQADGTLVLRSEATGEALLTASVPAVGGAPRGRGKAPTVLKANLTEGTPGGQRGFSAGADDDGDGLVDEDRKDGRDNDGDGSVDEDFAAISDDMTVVHRREGAAWVHQESYHWSYPLLRPAVFLSLGAEAAGLVALEVSTGSGQWLETDISSLRHTASGRPESHVNHAFVTQVDTPVSGPLWLAVMLLGDRPGYLAMGSDRANELDFPLSASPLPLVVCAARSWLQLSGMLAESDKVYRGVSDPLSKRTAGWIVPPPCSLCRSAGLPVMTFGSEGDRDRVLKVHILAGQSALFDPDLFQVNGRSLGSPQEILWLPDSGPARRMNWSGVSRARLRGQGDAPAVPYSQVEALMGHKAAGTLTFKFTGADLPVSSQDGNLSGLWLDGRSFSTEIKTPGKPGAWTLPVQGALVDTQPGITAVDPSEVEDPQIQTAGWRPPTLAPELLEGWPNPFRDVIQIKFKVPETVGEAFVWVDDEDAPKNLDPQAAVPWDGGSPTASIKIYNINGQELMTLHDGSVTGGEYTVNWNGTDIYGRQVASGTYFCKLQLDQWSVTRRIVYLR